ncbi:F-box protein At3g07870-like [Silene latifolia]|uniref:F-box protein At3g07870-like n=1 Tax=Silene latifolia TaxID=37657 RepID=UPI003D785DBD
MSDINPCISEDIWFEILKELPVKTLGKCRCVCKSWHSIIVSASFIAAHLKHYTGNDTNSLILYKGSDERYILFRDLAQLKKGNKLHTSDFPFVVPVHNLTFCFKFVGSVNGLLCVSDSRYLSPTDRILLWNPLIQKSIKLSKSTFTGEKSVVGFGYDYRRNDHLLVKISYWGINMPLVEVYSVQGRTWRTISSKYLVDNLINNISSLHCFCNGIIHWLTTQEAEINSSLRKWLLLFDV